MLKPHLILLEVTNRCNLNCVFCNHKHKHDFPQYDGTPQDMGFKLYKKIVDETADFAETIHPDGCGEPLLYPHIVEAIKYATKKGKKTMFFTNATMLDKKRTHGLLEANLTRIMFSVDGCNRISYEPFRVGASWDVVLKNIRYFLKYKRRGGYKTKVTVRITRVPEIYPNKYSNVPTLNTIVKFWRSMGIKHVRITPEVAIPPPSKFLDPSKWSSRGMKFSCNKLNKHLTVNVAGKVVLCCVDYLGAYVIGDLNKQSPLEAFNSKEANRIRKAMITGKKYPRFCDYCPDPDKKMIPPKKIFSLQSPRRPRIDLSKWQS